jgi:hypothetical protein
MNIQTAHMLNATQIKAWKKKLYWALPLFFLIKGLLWLAVSVISAIYVFD